MCINKQGIENDITSVQLSLIFNWSKADFHHWLSTAARELTTKPACPRKVSLSRSAFLLWFPARAKAPSFFRSLEAPSLCTLSSEKMTFGGILKKKKKVNFYSYPLIPGASQTFVPLWSLGSGRSCVSGSRISIFSRPSRTEPTPGTLPKSISIPTQRFPHFVQFPKALRNMLPKEM